MTASGLGRRPGLGDGMVIGASIRARVLGMRLLTIDADVAVVPQDPRPAAARPEPEPPANELLAAAGSRDAMAEANARLESSAFLLAAARERTPESYEPSGG